MGALTLSVLRTRRQRFAAVALLFAALITAIVSFTAHNAKDNHPAKLSAGNNVVGELASSAGAITATGACVSAPNPLTCGGALSLDAGFLNTYGGQAPTSLAVSEEEEIPVPAL